jgi:hypothetical protein
MAEYDGLTPGQVLADASVAEFIKTLGLGIAEAQKALDENSVQQIAEFIVPRPGLGGKTLLDLGLSPAFYHYQHADLTCSMQLSLKVQKNLSLGLNVNGSFNDTSNNSSNSTNSTSSTESGSSTRTESRTANIHITSASRGGLVVGGQNFPLTGASPEERINNLQNALTSSESTGVSRVLFELQGSDLTISETPDSPSVVTTPRSVAFIGGGFDRGVIRVGENLNTVFGLDDSPATSATTTAQADLAAYAVHVAATIAALNYTTTHVAPSEPIYTPHFDTGKHFLKPVDTEQLRILAQFLIATNTSITLQGFADRQRYSPNNSVDTRLNIQLGNNRAKAVKEFLINNGVPTALIQVLDSPGSEAAPPTPVDNQAFRKVDIKTPGRTHHLIIVHSRTGGPNLNGVTPNMVGNSSSSNGFVFLYRPSPLNLTGGVTINSVLFNYRSAAAGSFPADSPEAYAKNLADDINANTSANLQASANANVVTISRNGDPFQLTLVTSSGRDITLSGTEGVTVTTQFTRSSSSNLTRQNTGNQAVAFGASLDVRFSRQFEMNVTGNSSISARLVSIPAPPQFLETVKQFLTPANTTGNSTANNTNSQGSNTGGGS